MSKMYLRDLILSKPLLKSLYTKYRSKTANDLMNSSELHNYIEQAEKVLLDKAPNIVVGLVKGADSYSDMGLVRERDYYPKYERFLRDNDITYEYYNPFLSNWMEEAQHFDLIIWHTHSDPATQMHAGDKIYTLENILNIKCFPSFHELWGYENKINSHYQYKAFNLPEIPTFVSHCRDEAISYVEKCDFPIISKIATGSSSYGVEKIENKPQALKMINSIFSYQGLKTYFPYFAQKDYVYFQEFIDGAEYDLRVICIGDKLLGYYRYPNKGDFKASGAGNYEKKEIPVEALELSYQTRQTFKASCLATDMVFCKKKNQFLIIESSIFIGVDTCEQLAVNGVPGMYVRDSENKYSFVEGKYWIQELALKEYFESNLDYEN